MPAAPATPRDSANLFPPRGLVRDDVAYIVPMAVFLLFTEIGNRFPAAYAWTYVAKTFVTAFLLILFRKSYTAIRWNFWYLGLAMGAVGIVQWIGMEKLLLLHVRHYPIYHVVPYNPRLEIASPLWRAAFIGCRLAGAVLVVPVMEELFWRDFLWRTVLAPADFKLAAVGEMDWKALLLVSVLFSLVHVQLLTALVWGLLIGLLLWLTRSLGACIVMHALTNLLLGLYVLRTGDWYFW